jgi:hypothetical protein
MRFYNQQHRHDCGIGLHVKRVYVCILDATGQVLLHRNVGSTPAASLQVVEPFRDALVAAAECLFTWYWHADVCAAEGIAFVLGHARAMKAIHWRESKERQARLLQDRDTLARRSTAAGLRVQGVNDQPIHHSLRVRIRREHWIKHVFYRPITNDERKPLEKPHRFHLEGRQPHS